MILKKTFLSFSLTIFVLFISCGPAAEDRSSMVARSKVVQDSIANAIRMAMAEAEGPAQAVVVPQQTAATTATANAATTKTSTNPPK